MRRILPFGLCWVLLGLALGDARALERVGEDVPHRIETAHPYRGPGDILLPKRIQEETLRYAGATYIAVHFERFELALGDYLIVRSPDGVQSWRYEGLGRAGMGTSPEGFWATHIKGDTAIVELFSRHDFGAHGFTIDRYARGYTEAELLDQDEPAVPTDAESICAPDDSEWAKCYQSSEPEIYDQSRAVARLLISGSFTCTGWLFGCEGHVMTNNHCISTQAMANNTDYEFMAEGATCSTNCAPSMGCPGVIAATTGTLIKTNNPLDYTLVKLPTNPTPTYGFLSIRDSGAVSGERIYIPQHALGWGKRIAVFSTHALDQSGFCEINSLNAQPCTGGPGDIGYYADTQGGSSGSPVLAYSDHRVVSLHHCGTCQNRGLDVLDLITDMGALLPECATEQLAGNIELNASRYACTNSVSIAVEDDSLRGESSHPVTADSQTETAGESVTLLPVPPGSGTFLGSLQLTAATPTGGNGQLSVSDGDTITVTYIDEDDGLGGVNIPREASADIDCVAPSISNVQAINIGTATATITWATNELSTSRVTYGLTPPGSLNVTSAALVTAHSLGLSGLSQCKKYFFWVTSVDDVGNSASNTNGGTYYSFDTVCTPPPVIRDTQPLMVEKVVPNGTQLKVYWDNQCVNAPATAKILFGPLDQVSSYGVSGSVCSISRLANPKTWTGVPAGNLWFIMSSDNSFGHESSWGVNSSGQERHGLVPSGQCGSIQKNLSGHCP